jgi:hypothetical protein
MIKESTKKDSTIESLKTKVQQF